MKNSVFLSMKMDRTHYNLTPLDLSVLPKISKIGNYEKAPNISIFHRKISSLNIPAALMGASHPTMEE